MSRWIIAAVVLGLVIVGPWRGVAVTAPGLAFRVQALPGGLSDFEHAYRIAGKVRLLFFWVSTEDMGGARITRRIETAGRSLALLIGSDPRHAPGGLNQWAFVREHAAGDLTTLFEIRIAAGGDSPDKANGGRASGGPGELSVLCSRVAPQDAASRAARVYAGRETTYRDVDHVLDLAEGGGDWKDMGIARPAGVAPGFLTALELMMRASADAAGESGAAPSCPGMSYVYKDAVYDLIPRRVERVEQLRTHAGVLHNLLRSDIVVRSRATGWTSGFKITYGATGALAGIPVAATYQPNWWFKVELDLDDEQDVPGDPSDAANVRRRIERLCVPPGT